MWLDEVIVKLVFICFSLLLMVMLKIEELQKEASNGVEFSHGCFYFGLVSRI